MMSGGLLRASRAATSAVLGANGGLKFGRHFAPVRFRSKKAILAAKAREEAGLEPIDEWAYNYIERKDGLFKPPHTVEEQIAYMNSEVYARTYQGMPIHHWYRRNIAGQFICQPKPRLFCIDKHGRYNVNHACPVCRDEYLFFDYRNPDLIKMFLKAGTDEPMEIVFTGLCREQYVLLKAQLLKAHEYGTLPFAVEFRRFIYKEWYPDWKADEEEEEMAVIDPTRHSRLHAHVEEVSSEPDVAFTTHKRDCNTQWDEWWLRHDKFAKKAR